MLVEPRGDSAFVLRLGDTPSPGLSRRIAALRRALMAAPPAGLRDAINGFVTLTVIYDPDVSSMAALAERARAIALDDASPMQSRAWTLPVCYDAACAPDLEYVATATGLPPEEVIRRHAAATYTVYLLGFSPGFPYLGDLDASLTLARRVDPRPRVPAGSVAIATAYTAIYPQETPGGWHIIGRTPVSLFDARHASPALLEPGDSVRFEPVTPSELQRLAAAVAAGTYAPPCRVVDHPV